MISPCAKDCPNRKVGCRTGCEKYQKYSEAKQKEYAEKKRQYELDDYTYRSMDRNNRRRSR